MRVVKKMHQDNTRNIDRRRNMAGINTDASLEAQSTMETTMRYKFGVEATFCSAPKIMPQLTAY